MGKFHILEVRDGKGTFREVEGEAVVIEGVQAFVRNSNTTGALLDCWTVSDVQTGMRISQVCGTEMGAIRNATQRLSGSGMAGFRVTQHRYEDNFGRSPSAPDIDIKDVIHQVIDRGAWDLRDKIQVIQGPQPPGDPETGEAICRNPCTQREAATCSRETHCGHH